LRKHRKYLKSSLRLSAYTDIILGKVRGENMNKDTGIEKKNELPPLCNIDGPGLQLAKELLEGKLIRYTDNRFQVSSGECKFIFKLNCEKDKCVLFYTQVPYIYPIPDDLKKSIQSDLESVMDAKINIIFINAGAQAQKENVLQTASLIGD